MKLSYALRKIGKEVNKRWPSINCGGCCVFAAIVGEELLKKGVYSTGIVAAYAARRGNVDIDETRNNVRKKRGLDYYYEWSNNGVDFNHVGLEIHIGEERKHYDSNTLRKPGRSLDSMSLYKGRLTVAELKRLANIKRAWNSSFDRRHIPHLTEFVQSEFAKVTVID